VIGRVGVATAELPERLQPKAMGLAGVLCVIGGVAAG